MEKKYRLVAAIIVKKGNTYLLAKKPRIQNSWQFPQGGIESGEMPENAAIRELNEECGATLCVELNTTPLGKYFYEFPNNFKKKYPDFIGAEVTFFSGILKKGLVEIDGKEIIDFIWANKKEIQKKVTPLYWDVIKDWLEE